MLKTARMTKNEQEDGKLARESDRTRYKPVEQPNDLVFARKARSSALRCSHNDLQLVR
jgi:hypothetical protein